MAHYAMIDANNKVVTIITGIDEHLTQIDENGLEIGGSSENWEKFYESLPWFEGLYCKQTSYNGNFRKTFAVIDGFYDPINDEFVVPKSEFRKNDEVNN